MKKPRVTKAQRFQSYKKKRYITVLQDSLRSGYGLDYIATELLKIDHEMTQPDFEVPKGYLTDKELKYWINKDNETKTKLKKENHE